MNTRIRLVACSWVAVTTAAIALSARAEPPRVVAMSPDHGDIDVDPALTHIRVTFDQDMSPMGRSICGGGPTFPEITGQPMWESVRVLAIPVKLSFGATYSMSMNCPSAQNFRSAGGEAAVMTPLSFRTAAAGVAPLAPVALTVESNRAAIEAMVRAIETSYSYRDRVVQNWDDVIEASRAALESATTRAGFARAAGRVLGAAQDPHISLGVNDARFGSVQRSITPNFDPRKLGPTIGELKQLNSISATGVINPGTPRAIGYILIGSWPGDGSLLRPAHDELTTMINVGVARIIVDVRSNGGGDELTARAFAARFTQGRSVYSRNRIRDNSRPGGWLGPYERAVQPIQEEAKENPHAAQVIADAGAAALPLFRGRIVVLQGSACMSSNESFLLMMRHGGHAVLMGETSAGSSGNPRPHELGNGVTLVLPSWEDMEPNGHIVEGRGIEPHEKVAFDPQAEKDTVIETAVKWFEAP